MPKPNMVLLIPIPCASPLSRQNGRSIGKPKSRRNSIDGQVSKKAQMETSSGKHRRSLFVLDTEAPWIRSFLHALPPDVTIHGFRIRNAFSFPGGWRGQFQKVGRSEKVTENWDDTWVSIPGWHKAFGLSSWLVNQQVKRALWRFGRPDAALFTLPWYAKVAGQMDVPIMAYYAHDTFRFYGWDRAKIIDLEGQLLRRCQVGFGVARQVVNDLQQLASTPVHYLPMATAWLPGEANPVGELAAKNDFAAIPKPCVGCVGQINSAAYDWELIEYLSVNCPAVHLVFIGPKFQEPPSAVVDRMAAIFSRPNVHWLGPKPHVHLPAYLNRFDVCINPLVVSEHNNRRSPLRLFDYLATDRPIVSTAIAEAFNHLPFISIAKDKEGFCRMLVEALKLPAATDLVHRRDYISANTWQERSGRFLQYVWTDSDNI